MRKQVIESKGITNAAELLAGVQHLVNLTGRNASDVLLDPGLVQLIEETLTDGSTVYDVRVLFFD